MPESKKTKVASALIRPWESEETQFLPNADRNSQMAHSSESTQPQSLEKVSFSKRKAPKHVSLPKIAILRSPISRTISPLNLREETDKSIVLSSRVVILEMLRSRLEAERSIHEQREVMAKFQFLFPLMGIQSKRKQLGNRLNELIHSHR